MKVRQLFQDKPDPLNEATYYNKIELNDGTIRDTGEIEDEELAQLVARGGRIFTADQLTSGGEFRTQIYEVEFQGQKFRPAPNNSWKINHEGMKKLIEFKRVVAGKNQIRFKWSISQDFCRSNQRQSCSALRPFNHGPKRFGVGHHLRKRHDGVRR